MSATRGSVLTTVTLPQDGAGSPVRGSRRWPRRRPSTTMPRSDVPPGAAGGGGRGGPAPGPGRGGAPRGAAANSQLLRGGSASGAAEIPRVHEGAHRWVEGAAGALGPGFGFREERGQPPRNGGGLTDGGAVHVAHGGGGVPGAQKGVHPLHFADRFLEHAACPPRRA